MTLWLCRHPNHQLLLGVGKSEIMEDAWGSKRMHETRPGVVVRFEGAALTTRAREVAEEIWFTARDGAAAMYPSSQPGLFRHIVMNEDGSGTWGGETFYRGARPETYISAYDSADPRHYVALPVDGKTLTPAQFTAMVDAALTEHAGNGDDFVRVDAIKLPAPWPGYDDLKGLEGAKKVREIIAATRIDPAKVIAYENQRGEQARPSYIQAAEDARAEAIQREETAAALEVAP
jgi:hypothetical protein